MEKFLHGVFLFVVSLLAMFFGALTLAAIPSWLWVGADNARLLLYVAPQFVIWGITAWAATVQTDISRLVERVAKDLRRATSQAAQPPRGAAGPARVRPKRSAPPSLAVGERRLDGRPGGWHATCFVFPRERPDMEAAAQRVVAWGEPCAPAAPPGGPR